MNIVDVGHGAPIVIVPGVQGRWEWMRPAVDALARTCRVITFSLADEPSAASHRRDAAFDTYVEQISDALAALHIERATICGVSFGGLIAAAFAARYPERVVSLVLVSALPPGWKPDARVRFYLRSPRLLAPLFCIASLRMYKEIAVAAQGRWAGMAAATRHGWNVTRHMFSPSRMARRVSLLEGIDLSERLRGVRCPALLLTGEDGLDRVVPPRLSRQYLTLWPQAKTTTIPRTGHLGLITRPDVFAGIVNGFVMDVQRGEARRRIG